MSDQRDDGAVRKDVAGLARVARQAPALVVVQLVDAESVVHARVHGALVDLGGAVLAGVSWRTCADKVIDGVVTGSSVGTRIQSTFVDVFFTMGAGESRGTVALVIGNKVDACAAVLARVDGTIVDVGFAMLAGEAFGADALVLVFVFGIHEASAAVLAGSGHATMVKLDVTVDTSESWLASALVSSWSVDAESSILAWQI